jgi:hypothetical protein
VTHATLAIAAAHATFAFPPVTATLYAAANQALRAVNEALAAHDVDTAQLAADAVAADASEIERGGTADERARLAEQVAGAPPWPAGISVAIAGAWTNFKRSLLTSDESWEVWV